MKPLLFLFLNCALLLSCIADGGDEEIDNEEDLPEIASTLDSDILLSFWQILEGENELLLLASNQDPVECLESLTPVLTGNNNLLLTFDHTLATANCQGEIIETAIDLGIRTGLMDIDIMANDITNMGSLEINDNFLGLKMRSSDGLVIPENEINLIPENIAWGYASITPDVANVNGIFNNSLTATITVELNNGNHGHFVYDKADEKLMSVNGTTEWGQAWVLDLPKDDSWSELGDILRRLAFEYPTMTYFFMNAEGEIHEN